METKQIILVALAFSIAACSKDAKPDTIQVVTVHDRDYIRPKWNYPDLRGMHMEEPPPVTKPPDGSVANEVPDSSVLEAPDAMVPGPDASEVGEDASIADAGNVSPDDAGPEEDAAVLQDAHVSEDAGPEIEQCPLSVSAQECNGGWALCEEQSIADIPRSVLIKGTNDAIYWYAADGARYVFPSEKVYRSWWAEDEDCPMIFQVSDEDLAATRIAGNISIRPGSYIVKLTTDPKVYAVSCGGLLHWFEQEAVASLVYGNDWQDFVIDIPDAFFVNYTIGLPVVSITDYDPDAELAATPTPDEDIACRKLL